MAKKLMMLMVALMCMFGNVYAKDIIKSQHGVIYVTGSSNTYSAFTLTKVPTTSSWAIMQLYSLPTTDSSVTTIVASKDFLVGSSSSSTMYTVRYWPYSSNGNCPYVQMDNSGNNIFSEPKDDVYVGNTPTTSVGQWFDWETWNIR